MKIDEINKMKTFVCENVYSDDINLKLLCVQYIIQLVKFGESVKDMPLPFSEEQYKTYLGRDLTGQEIEYFYKTPNYVLLSNGELSVTAYYFTINPEFNEQNRG